MILFRTILNDPSDITSLCVSTYNNVYFQFALISVTVEICMFRDLE